MKIFLHMNDCKSQIPRVKALKYREVEMEFFLSSMLNFQSHWWPAGRNFGDPKFWGLRGLCFQDTHRLVKFQVWLQANARTLKIKIELCGWKLHKVQKINKHN